MSSVTNGDRRRAEWPSDSFPCPRANMQQRNRNPIFLTINCNLLSLRTKQQKNQRQKIAFKVFFRKASTRTFVSFIFLLRFSSIPGWQANQWRSRRWWNCDFVWPARLSSNRSALLFNFVSLIVSISHNYNAGLADGNRSEWMKPTERPFTYHSLVL